SDRVLRRRFRVVRRGDGPCAVRAAAAAADDAARRLPRRGGEPMITAAPVAQPISKSGDRSTAQQLAEFIAPRFEPDDVIEFRLVRNERAKSSWHVVRDVLANADDFAEALASDNNDGWHVYLGANPR